MLSNAFHSPLEFFKGTTVRRGTAPEHDIDRLLYRQQKSSSQFSKTAFQPIPRHRALSVQWSNNPYSYIADRGGKVPGINV